ncbi:MAG: alpha/beta fold hydrolase [Kofleriaceae bacterium]|nr:alpha/beta fold hydrolase [Kofleriaceae bacterium]
MAHGFNGSPENEWGVNPTIVEALRSDGHQIYVARVSPFQSVTVRGGELAQEIDRALLEFDADKVNVIAHSMGGLDSRYAISALGYDDRVAALVTISTPHRGSLSADAALGLIPGLLDAALNALTRAFARTFTSDELANNSDLRAAFASISEDKAPAFNEAHPDVAGVYYQSWAGLSNAGRIGLDSDLGPCQVDGGKLYFSDGKRDFMDLRLVLGAAIVAHGTSLLPNDGMTTIESARWGDFMGCIPADQYDEIGQVDDEGPQSATGFDAEAFYRTIAFDLELRGY